MNKTCRVLRSRIARLLKVRKIEDVTTEEYVRRLRKLSEDVMDREEAETAAKIFSALSDPVRISVLKLVSRRRRMCVCELMIALGLSQPAISYHLKLLRECGLIRPVRSGRWVFYEIANRRLANLVFKLVESV